MRDLFRPRAVNDTPRIHSAGAVIREHRQRAELSLNDLAKRLGWDKGRLSKYENDGLGLSARVIERIAQALGVRPEVLLLECLKHRYPALRKPRSEAARLITKLINELAKPQNVR